jgi:molybdate transport system substrate-binding protein
MAGLDPAMTWLVRWLRQAAVAVLIASLAVSPVKAADSVVVFAAASLRNALDDVNAAWKDDTGKQITISYAASPALARQIAAAAPADVFISADLQWMRYLAEKNLIRPQSEIHLLGNRLVLIAPNETDVEVAIAPGFPLDKLLGEGRLAMGDVKAVPAGRYGKAALETLGVWATVEDKVAQTENVRAALKLVATGEAALGIVYRTDANAEPAVKVLGTFPDSTHEPIIYPAALIASSANPDAEEFLRYLQSARAKVLFEKQGFTFLVAALSN